MAVPIRGIPVIGRSWKISLWDPPWGILSEGFDQSQVLQELVHWIGTGGVGGVGVVLGIHRGLTAPDQ